MRFSPSPSLLLEPLAPEPYWLELPLIEPLCWLGLEWLDPYWPELPLDEDEELEKLEAICCMPSLALSATTRPAAAAIWLAPSLAMSMVRSATPLTFSNCSWA